MESSVDALEQALWARHRNVELIHYRDHASQYLATRYTERLLEEGIDSAVGSVGGSYDSAMAGPIGDIPPIELAKAYYDSLEAPAVAAGLN